MHKKAPVKPKRRAPSKTLREAGEYLGELANTVPEHSAWLTVLANRLKREAAAIKKKKATEASERGKEPALLRAPVPRVKEDLRRYSRRIVAVPAHLYGNTGACKALISELSEAGLKVATGLACRVGEEVVVAWRFEREEDPLEVTGVVRYRTADGTGIEFVDLSPFDRLRIRRYCERMQGNLQPILDTAAD